MLGVDNVSITAKLAVCASMYVPEHPLDIGVDYAGRLDVSPWGPPVAWLEVDDKTHEFTVIRIHTPVDFDFIRRLLGHCASVVNSFD